MKNDRNAKVESVNSGKKTWVAPELSFLDKNKVINGTTSSWIGFRLHLVS